MLRSRTFVLPLALMLMSTMADAQQGRLGAAGTNLQNHRGRVGKRITLVCPSQKGSEPVYGSDVYTDDSPVCSAAVHAGLITLDRGGPVTVVVGGPQASYKGSVRNGVTSKDYGEWPGSYSFDRSGRPADVDWSTTANGVEGYSGTVTVQCPPGGTPRRVWGTDVYTTDSSICAAAAHAGIITLADGGPVSVRATQGRDSYRGSDRNGVASNSYGSWPASLEVTAPAIAAKSLSATAPSRAGDRSGQAAPATSAVQTAPTSANTARAPQQAPQSPRDQLRGLTAPANVAATYLSGGTVALAWDSVPGATSYDIISTTPSHPAGFGVNEAPVTTPYHVSRALTPDTYTMIVRANDGSTTSPESQRVTVTVPQWSGKYRVTINGFKVTHETFDNPAEVDGKRDEVYVQATTQVFHTVGAQLAPKTTVRSWTHGDRNAARWQNAGSANYRIKAGSASAMGGLMTGDAYPNNLMPWKRAPGADEMTRGFPLLVWDGELYQDMNTVVILPSIWEDDEKPANDAMEAEYLNPLQVATTPMRQQDWTRVGGHDKIMYDRAVMVTKPVFRKMRVLMDHLTSVRQAMPGNAAVASMVNSVVPKFQAAATRWLSMAGTLALMSNSQDRPIGLEPSGGQPTFDPPVVMLNYQHAEDIIAGRVEGQIAPGIIAINYQDQVGGGHGDYTLFLEVRRN